MKTVTFRQLRVFVEVARHLSFVRAAEALHLTPPGHASRGRGGGLPIIAGT